MKLLVMQLSSFNIIIIIIIIIIMITIITDKCELIIAQLLKPQCAHSTIIQVQKR
jgi:hypothetical protein